MRTKLILLYIATFYSLSSICQTYIKNVTIVDVEKKKLIPDQTVTITGNLISGISSSKKIKIPPNSVTIGQGKCLVHCA